MHMKLSLVVPCYNEEENVAAFQQAVIAAFQGCGYSYEIIFVDDGSSDGTLTQLEALYRSQACPVSVVSFSRNFGKGSRTVCRPAPCQGGIYQPDRCRLAAAAGVGTANGGDSGHPAGI